MLVVYSFNRDADDDEDGETRLGLAVPRRVGDAVTRNRAKRKLREAFTTVSADLEGTCDVVIVARPGLAESLERETPQWLEAELRGLLARTTTASEQTA